MDKKLKKKWVAALRSGNYKQGIGALCQFKDGEAKYCCLGVLAEEEGGEGVWGDTVILSNGMTILRTKDGGAVTYGGGHFDFTDASKLSGMNDFSRNSFDEIADWIEANV